MANFFDQFDGASADEITPTKRALLNSVAAGEAPDYNTVYGGGRFEEMNDHPRRAVPIRSGPNAGRTSSAAGRYQFLGSTWDEAKNALGLPDFSPDSQDRAAAWLAERDYKKRTGRDLWADVEEAKADPRKLNFIGGALSKTWTSLPGGIEPNGATGGFARRMTDEFSSQSRQPQQAPGNPMLIAPTQGAPTQPVTTANFFDQFDGETAQPQPQEQRAPEGHVAPQQSMMQKALEPITSYPETYQGMRKEGAQQLSTGVEQARSAVSGEDVMGYPVESRAWEGARGVGNAALGGLGYLASPINAALRTVVGKPVEENTGIPKEYTEFAASLALPVMGMTKVSGVQAPARTLKPGEQVAAAANRLGVDIPAAVVSDSPAIQRAAAVTRNVPLAGDPIVKATERTITQLGDKAADVTKGYGSGDTFAAGEAASGAIKNWIKGESAATSNKFYDRVDDLVDNSVRTPLANTRQAADEILSRRANANIADESQAVRKVKAALDDTSGMNYEGIKDLRTYIREMKDNPSLLPHDISGKELNKIYDGLSSDLTAAVKNAGGPKAEVAFERANRHYALVSERREQLAKIVGADGNAPAEQVFDRLLAKAGSTARADVESLGRARKAIGADDWNEFASGVVARMGRDTSKGAPESLQGAQFSPQRFLTAYDKMTDAGRNMLFRSGGKTELAGSLRDIAEVSKRFKELQKYSNPSGTAQNVTGAGLGGAVMAAPLTTISTVVGGNILARVLARPATVAPAAQWSRKYEIVVRSPTPANVAQLSIASRNLANTVNAEFGTSVNWQDFLKAMQGPIPARADKENQ